MLVIIILKTTTIAVLLVVVVVVIIIRIKAESYISSSYVHTFYDFKLFAYFLYPNL